MTMLLPIPMTMLFPIPMLLPIPMLQIETSPVLPFPFVVHFQTGLDILTYCESTLAFQNVGGFRGVYPSIRNNHKPPQKNQGRSGQAYNPGLSLSIDDNLIICIHIYIYIYVSVLHIIIKPACRAPPHP